MITTLDQKCETLGRHSKIAPNACLVEFHHGGDGSALEQVQFNAGESGAEHARGLKLAKEGSDSDHPMNESPQEVRQVSNSLLFTSVDNIAHMTTVGSGWTGSRQEGRSQSPKGAQP